jgi:hypothetical protein
MESFVLWSLTVWPAKGLNNFISAALRMFSLQLRISVDFVQRPWNIWDDDIKLDLKEIVCYTVDWIHLFQDMGH